MCSTVSYKYISHAGLEVSLNYIIVLFFFLFFFMCVCVDAAGGEIASFHMGENCVRF